MVLFWEWTSRGGPGWNGRDADSGSSNGMSSARNLGRICRPSILNASGVAATAAGTSPAGVNSAGRPCRGRVPERVGGDDLLTPPPCSHHVDQRLQRLHTVLLRQFTNTQFELRPAAGIAGNAFYPFHV